MKRLLSALLLAALSFAASAEVWQARYGVGETFNFKLYNADGTLDVDEADGGTEVSLSCNEGEETTATNDFVDEGTFYSIALTATEMQCERIAVVVAATTTEVFFIQTHSNASAMTPASDSNTSHWGGTAVASARPLVDAVQISGDSGAADALENWMDGTAGAVPGTGIVDRGTLQAVDGDSAQLRDAATFGDNMLNGATIVLTSGTYAGLRGAITDYTSTGDAAAVTWSGGVTPSGTPTYEIWGTTEITGGGSAPSASEVAEAVATELGTGTQFTAIPWNASWDAEVQSEATDALNAYDPPTRAELTSDIDGLNDLSAADVRDLVVEDQGSVTLGCALAVMQAMLAGDYTTSGETVTVEDPSGTETRVSSTLSSGTRTVTITCPSY